MVEAAVLKTAKSGFEPLVPHYNGVRHLVRSRFGAVNPATPVRIRSDTLPL
jgi:hypothetical protein